MERIAADSGNIDTGSGGSNQLELTHTFGNAGYISFARKFTVNTSSSTITTSFYIDNVLQASVDSTQDWQNLVYDVAAGSHTFKWTFTTTGNAQGSKVWIDDVNLQDGGYTEVALNDGYEDNTLSPFSGGGTSGWVTTSSDKNTGTYSARSAAIGDSQTSDMSLTFNVVKSGRINFYKKVSTQSDSSGDDFFQFFIDGNMIGQWSGFKHGRNLRFRYLPASIPLLGDMLKIVKKLLVQMLYGSMMFLLSTLAMYILPPKHFMRR